MDSGYFICDVLAGRVYTSGCVTDGVVITLPDGHFIFHSVLTNGQELIVVSGKGETTVFDMPVSDVSPEIRLYVDDITENYSCIGVQTVTKDAINVLGDLIISEDMTIFEAEVIGTEKAQKLWTKAVMLCGTSAS